MDKKAVYVCLIGKKGSGKSTAARMLAKYLGRDQWRVVAFADPLKRLCATSYGFVLGLSYDRDGKDARPSWASVENRKDLKVPPLSTTDGILNGLHRKVLDKLESLIAREFEFMADVGIPITVGRILQTVGEMCRLVIGKTFWADRLVRDHNVMGGHYIIEDMRYPEELEVMKKTGALLISIKRDETPHDSRSTVHPSETAMNGIAIDLFATIDNNGTERELVETVMVIARKIAITM